MYTTRTDPVKTVAGGDRASKPQARPNDACVICGPANPRGLRLRFSADGEGAVSAPWRPSSDLEGFRGVIHGGVVAAVLDEAMSKAVASVGWRALTCELRVRYRHAVAAGERLSVRARVTGKRKRQIAAAASLVREDGSERATASAVFLLLR